MKPVEPELDNRFYRRTIALIADIFLVDPDELHPKFQLESLPNWNSLNIFLLFDALTEGHKFPPQFADLLAAKTIGEIIVVTNLGRDN